MSISKKLNKIHDTASVEEFLRFGEATNPIALTNPINIRDTDHKYELEMSAPGFRKSDFTITSVGNLLTITAVREHKKNKDDNTFTRKEYFRPSINRSFGLPEDVLLGHISASYHDGILTIDLQKIDKFLIGKKQINVD